MNNNIEIFKELVIQVVEKLRFVEKLSGDLVNELYSVFDKICREYEGKESIPKSIVFDVLTLHDNLEGALNHYPEDQQAYIASINSKISIFIERLLLS